MKRKGRKVDPIFDNFMMVSPKQIELAIFIRQYRRIHELSQAEMAKICTLYGEPSGIKFTNFDISVYENCKTVPTTPKFQVLMNTMNITPQML